MAISINSKTRLLGLFGNPSRHSLSPLIQNHFLSCYKINFVYLTFEPPAENLKIAFESAKNLNFAGLNITMPFKEEVFKLVDKNIGTAAAIKAVNTIKFLEEGKVSYGYSTDGDGVIKSLNDKKIILNGKSCLILGAGGAAKSAVYAILQKNIGKVFIYDIIREKAPGLTEDLKNNLSSGASSSKNKINTKKELKHAETGKEIKFNDIDKKISILTDLKDIESSFDSVDLIINCTPVGMDTGNYKDMLPIPRYWNLKDKYIFEMVYKPVNTEFLKKGKKEGAAAAINGIDMLINQAVFSFKIWFDIIPEEKIIKQVREKILKII